MILLTGTLYDVLHTRPTNRETGVQDDVFTAEILHKSAGKSVIDTLKLDRTAYDLWLKIKSKDISVEIRQYAMKDERGGLRTGITLADKRALPTLLRPQSTPT